MSGKSLVVLALIGAIGFGLYQYKTRAREFPNIALTGDREKSTTVADLGKGKPSVLIFLLSGCPLSKYSADMVSGLAREHSSNATFTGVMLRGDRTEATNYETQNSLSFPVYALDVAKDPFSLQAMQELIGESQGIYGGTVVVIDQYRKIRFRAVREDVKKLKEKLESMGL